MKIRSSVVLVAALVQRMTLDGINKGNRKKKKNKTCQRHEKKKKKKRDNKTLPTYR